MRCSALLCMLFSNFPNEMANLFESPLMNGPTKLLINRTDQSITYLHNFVEQL